MRSGRRSAPATLVLAALLALPLLSVCAGWAVTPGGRRACCASAEHRCDGSAADRCCAAGEGRRNGEHPAYTALIQPLTPSAVLRKAPADAEDAHRVLASAFAAAGRARGSTDTLSLLSVFLI